MNTIAAISTATGTGGIGIIRMSGNECFEILQKIFIPKNKEKEICGYTIKYGNIVNPKNDEIVDEVLVSYFKSPLSYTTENMCEINSHGGMIIQRKILELCLENGAELAQPGEFTQRAFLNGRIDLAQAESVIDIINSKTDAEAKASINQLEGILSNNISEIRNQLLDVMADMEANIDYPEYDIEEITNKKILGVLENVKQKLISLENSFACGKILKDGVKTAILGKPNAGKSSLLNTILKEERAIVSEYEGTTRDTIEEFINVNGIPLKIIDTAGIRDTEDQIEKIGVSKAIKIAEEADLIIAIFDCTKKLDEQDLKILEIIKNKNAIILLNKIDLENNLLKEDEQIEKCMKPVIQISAQKNIGVDKLYALITKMFNIGNIKENDGTVITNVRHKNQINKAINSLDEAISTIGAGMPIDIIAINIKQTLSDLGKITGDDVSEDIIKEIFSKFCLGK